MKKFSAHLLIVMCILIVHTSSVSASSFQVTMDGLNSYPSSMVVADFNNDGAADFSVASRVSTGLSVFLSSTIGKSYTELIISTSSTRVADLLAFDRNRDGRQDLVISPIDGTSFLRGFNNVSNGNFSPSQIIGGTSPVAEALIAADINKDGKSEIIALPSYSGANGGLVPLTKYLSVLKPDSTNLYFSAHESLTHYDYLSSSDVGDIDGNGFVDFAASSNIAGAEDEGEPGDVKIWFNSNGRLGLGVSTLLENVPSINQIKISDVTGDGQNELLVVSNDLGLLVYDYVDSYAFSNPKFVTGTENARAIAIDDLNKDGRNEIILLRELPSGVEVSTYDFVNNALYKTDSVLDSNIKLALFTSTSSLSSGSDVDVVSIDFDFDGSNEIVVPGNTISSNEGSLFVFDISPIYIEYSNLPPLLEVSTQTTSEATLLQFTLTATDPNNDPLTYSSSNLPAGATINSATGEFSWTPGYNDAGTYPVTFSVSDGELSDIKTVDIIVTNTNRAPVITDIGSQTTTESQNLTFTLSASDPDGDTLTYSASNLPVGATFNPSTRTFSWTPTYAQAGNYDNVEFTVTDNGTPLELDVELITITVGDINRAPEFVSPGAQEVQETQSLSFALEATDPDGDTLTYSASNLPAGATFNTATQVFSWTPTQSQSGVYTPTFTATDNGTPVEFGTIDVVITVGDTPTPLEQAETLVDTVTTLLLPTNVQNAYLANLQKVGNFITDGKIQSAINQLNAFISKVNQDYAQGKITLAIRNSLVSLAQQLVGEIQ